MSTKAVAVLLHVISSIIALVTSETQTKRIMKNTSRYERISLSIKGVGIIVAGGGTLVILKKLKDGMKVLKDTNDVVRKRY